MGRLLPLRCGVPSRAGAAADDGADDDEYPKSCPYCDDASFSTEEAYEDHLVYFHGRLPEDAPDDAED